MKSNPSILVCGGAGYIGAHVVPCLLQAGRQVVVLDDLSTGHRAALPREIPLISGSIGCRDLLDRVFGQYSIDSVVHLCASCSVAESVENPLKYYDNNLANGLVLIRALLDHGVRKIVFSSSAAVYGNPQFTPITENHPLCPANPYGWSKLVLEQLLSDLGRANDLRSVALRYFNAAGALPDGSIGEDHRPETHLIPLTLKMALRIKHPELGEHLPEAVEVFGTDYATADGTCVRDYIHVCDLAEAHLLALDYLDNGGASGVFNLGNGSGFSVNQVIQTAERITGQRIPRRIASRRPGDPPVLVSDSTRARRVLGFSPRCPGLEEIIGSAWKFHLRFPKGFPGK